MSENTEGGENLWSVANTFECRVGENAPASAPDTDDPFSVNTFSWNLKGFQDCIFTFLVNKNPLHHPKPI